MSEIQVHDYLEDYLQELSQHDCIFDKFEVVTSSCGQTFATGSYDSNFVVGSSSPTSPQMETIHCGTDPLPKPKSNRKSGRQLTPGTNECKMSSELMLTRNPTAQRKLENRDRVTNMDFAKKSLHMAYHPHLDAVAVASLNKVHIYQNM